MIKRGTSRKFSIGATACIPSQPVKEHAHRPLLLGTISSGYELTGIYFDDCARRDASLRASRKTGEKKKNNYSQNHFHSLPTRLKKDLEPIPDFGKQSKARPVSIYGTPGHIFWHVLFTCYKAVLSVLFQFQTT